MPNLPGFKLSSILFCRVRKPKMKFLIVQFEQQFKIMEVMEGYHSMTMKDKSKLNL